MPANYVLLEKITVGAASASSVTFSSIPQTGYTDLMIYSSTRSTGTNGTCNVYFNNDTTDSNYDSRRLLGDGSAASSGNQPNLPYFMYANASNMTSSTFANGLIYIPNYTSSNYKSVSTDVVMENNGTLAYSFLVAGLWKSTSAITSIKLDPASGTEEFAQYSTFYLYGVAKLGTTPAIAPKATGGDTIMTDGTYWYHAFKSSGTFTPVTALSCDVLVVAGGGGGGSYRGGGGGAGGALAFAAQSIGTAQTVTIGAGGAGGTAGRGTSGSNTTFGSLTAATGGGNGGSAVDGANATGANGGSGGGGVAQLWAGGTGTSGQGSNGGTGNDYSGYYGSGGGGGASASGSNGTSAGGGVGGAGTNSVTNWGALSTVLSITGLGVSGYIAGGGAGGAIFSAPTTNGGSGGGGNSPTNSNGGNGTANTGGGGGGANSTSDGVKNNGGAGGSGLVVVRYAV